MVGNAFGVSRTIVRKVFLIMEQEGIVALPLNRGAFVATPAPEEVKPLFETLRLVMPYVIRNIVKTMDDDAQSRLRLHFETEAGLDHSQEARVNRRLAQEYFILLADLHGNPMITNLIERVTTRITMAMTLYQDMLAGWRPGENHTQINEALLKGDGEKAVNLLLKNLEITESTMQFENQESSFDISAILSSEDDQVYPKARRASKPRSRRVSVGNGESVGSKRNHPVIN